MPPSPLFELFKEVSCKRLIISTTLNIPPATMKKVKAKVRDLWVGKVYPGEGRLKVVLGCLLFPDEGPSAKKHQYGLNMFCILTESENLATEYAMFEGPLRETFGEREVNVMAEFSFDKNQIISLFRGFDVGEQSQILDEIVGFTGVKRDSEGKNLYTMEIAINDTFIEIKLSFRQTVRLEENMPLALLETASKISALAVRPKETQ
jgi:hypothetical protein